ncbi:hypothetical protein HRR78_006638 [Exophiala dermatitidis]|nr:hypothetical protein HRR78_006638 [Exophiala dermatitidis]
MQDYDDMLNAVVQSNLTLDRSVLVPSITEMPYYLPHLRSTELTGFTHHSSAYELNVIQQPRDGHVPSSPHKRNGMQGQQKLSRSHADTDTARSAVKWPLDPPLVVEFKVNNNDTSKAYLTSPYWFCLVTIEAVNGEPVTPDTLFGTLTSSLHRVKMQDSRDHGVFVYGDLHIKFAGVFKLRITLFEMRQRGESMFSAKLASSISEPFEIRASRVPSPLRESTALSKALADAGVKLRIRKEPS